MYEYDVFKYEVPDTIAAIKKIMMFEKDNVDYFLPFRPVYSTY
ncbi:MAG: hypothetical protein GQF41_0303 [Candidatus Rifleibacterium amylolyticum]|nr:MAG: hypothetical protein GQF41_0303 [Candidatus Rifleibacterium amylolyticum]